MNRHFIVKIIASFLIVTMNPTQLFAANIDCRQRLLELDELLNKTQNRLSIEQKINVLNEIEEMSMICDTNQKREIPQTKRSQSTINLGEKMSEINMLKAELYKAKKENNTQKISQLQQIIAQKEAALSAGK